MSAKGHKVVAWTPYGRERTVSILAEYMKRDHAAGVVDEWWLYLNTPRTHEGHIDLEYARDLAEDHRFIKLIERPDGCEWQTPIQRNTGYAYRYMTDPSTVYIRFDDDIVYVHPDAVLNLAESCVEWRDSQLACFGLIWNNAICTWYLQQAGVVPTEWGKTYPFCMDPVGWADGEFAVKMHEKLLDLLEDGGDDAAKAVYLYQDMPLVPGQQFSVSYFAAGGWVYAGLPEPGVLTSDEEEHWHTIHQPRVGGLGNVIVGDSLVSHYSFKPQQSVLNDTDILDRYRALAAKL